MDKHYIRSVWEKFLEVQEAKHKKNEKLDPVGQEDGDIDNDGDKDSSDEYLAKRRKAIGKAMAKESNCDDRQEDKSQFMYAAKQAKKKGDQEFVFAGKKYKVEDAYAMDEEDYPVPPKTKKPGDALEPVNNRTAKLKEDETDKPYPTPKKVKKAGDELEDVKNRTSKLKEWSGKEGKNRRVAGGDGRKLKEDENDTPYPTPKKVKKAGDELEDVKNRTSKLKESEELEEVSTDAMARTLEQRIAQLKKVKDQDNKIWDQIAAATKKGDERTYMKLKKDSEKLDKEMEKIRGSIRMLQTKIKFGDSIVANPNVYKRKAYGENLDTSLFSESELAALEERMETAGATAPEGLMDKESPKSKKFAADHQKSNAKFENIPAQAADDASKSGKATKQSAARNAGDNLSNGDPKTPGFKNPGQA